MARVTKPEPAYPSVEKFVKVVTSSNPDDLDASYRARVEAVLNAVCRPWFQHENVARQSSAPSNPIASTRLR